MDLYSKLIARSKADAQKPYDDFVWVDGLDGMRWMPDELTSLWGTEAYGRLRDDQRRLLSQLELVNLFSITFHGERQILRDVLRFQDADFSPAAEYLFSFVDEEARHMHMFFMFCKKVGRPLYDLKRVASDAPQSLEVSRFIAFAQTLVAEEIVDYYNVRLAADESLPAAVRRINDRHHRDESRHIAMGREQVARLWSALSREADDEVLDRLRADTTKYFRQVLSDFFNPTVYQQVGLPEPYEVRRHAIRERLGGSILHTSSVRLVKYLSSLGILGVIG